MAKLLTKSKYIMGLESDCLLWRLINDPSSLPEPDAFTQSKFDAGHEVGELAKKLYPDGVDFGQKRGIIKANLVYNLNDNLFLFGGVQKIDKEQAEQYLIEEGLQ